MRSLVGDQKNGGSANVFCIVRFWKILELKKRSRSVQEVFSKVNSSHELTFTNFQPPLVGANTTIHICISVPSKPIWASVEASSAQSSWTIASSFYTTIFTLLPPNNLSIAYLRRYASRSFCPSLAAFLPQ